MRTRLDKREVGPAHPPSHSGGGAIHFEGEPAAPCCQGDELRCGCGSLLARRVGASVELKCRRCKRVWTLPLDG